MEARLGSAENDVANHDRRLEELVEDFEHATSHEESTQHREPVAEQVALLLDAVDELMQALREAAEEMGSPRLRAAVEAQAPRMESARRTLAARPREA